MYELMVFRLIKTEIERITGAVQVSLQHSRGVSRATVSAQQAVQALVTVEGFIDFWKKNERNVFASIKKVIQEVANNEVSTTDPCVVFERVAQRLYMHSDCKVKRKRKAAQGIVSILSPGPRTYAVNCLA